MSYKVCSARKIYFPQFFVFPIIRTLSKTPLLTYCIPVQSPNVFKGVKYLKYMKKIFLLSGAHDNFFVSEE